jgi:hypothetical protein
LEVRRRASERARAACSVVNGSSQVAGAQRTGAVRVEEVEGLADLLLLLLRQLELGGLLRGRLAAARNGGPAKKRRGESEGD